MIRLPRAQVSLSARRAWIEISGVDFAEDWLESLSARRAWIEITVVTAKDWASVVALRKESVDRNAGIPAHCKAFSRRSPQGERG